MTNKPAILRLQRNVQFLYEEQLARLELQALGCATGARDDNDAWQITASLNGQAPDILQRSAYIGEIDGKPTVYAEMTRPGYQGGRFNRTRSVNQYLTHWIYPYRGKFHPQMVRALFNLLGAQPGQLAVDPFVGSGTAAVEASLLGLRFIGIDLSPLCVMLTRVKTRSVEAVDAIRERVAELLASEALDVDAIDPAVEDNPRVADFLQIARMVTYSDVARRSREAGASFRRNLEGMLVSVEAYAGAITEFKLQPGSVEVRQGDARALGAAGIADDSVDVIVTSPPYSIALDYVKNDDHALEALGVDTKGLRASMTGVRGRGPRQKLALYNEDMQETFKEVARVLKPGARAAFVVGDATVDGREVTTTGTMSAWAEAVGLRVERNIPKIVYGLYSVMSDERMLVFRKP